MEIIVRSATLADLATLREFEQGVIDAERPLDPDLRLDHIQYYDLNALIKTEQAEVCVVTLDDNIISCGYAKIEDSKSWHTYERYCYLGFMYTLPAFRGRGMNQKVIDHLTLWSQHNGVSKLILEVYHNNPGAIKAYQKAGFESRLLEMRLDI